CSTYIHNTVNPQTKKTAHYERFFIMLFFELKCHIKPYTQSVTSLEAFISIIVINRLESKVGRNILVYFQHGVQLIVDINILWVFQIVRIQVQDILYREVFHHIKFV